MALFSWQHKVTSLQPSSATPAQADTGHYGMRDLDRHCDFVENVLRSRIDVDQVGVDALTSNAKSPITFIDKLTEQAGTFSKVKDAIKTFVIVNSASEAQWNDTQQLQAGEMASFVSAIIGRSRNQTTDGLPNH